MRISDWSSDVCSSDLQCDPPGPRIVRVVPPAMPIVRLVVHESIRRVALVVVVRLLPSAPSDVSSSAHNGPRSEESPVRKVCVSTFYIRGSQYILIYNNLTITQVTLMFT